jgi:hypothetical protein
MGGFFKAGKRRSVWPKARIEAAIRKAFAKLLVIGEDQDHTIYDVEDRNLRFVVALVHERGPDAGVSEVGFLARFVEYPANDKALRKVNGGVHLGAAFVEDGELYLMAKVAAQGPFNETRFGLVLEAWRRDLKFVVTALSPRKSADTDDPVELGFAAAQIGERPAVFFRSFFWRNNPVSLCAACRGRGRSGLLARECRSCEGKGFAEAEAPAAG